MHFGFDILAWLPVFICGTLLWFLVPLKRHAGKVLVLGILLILIPWYLAGFGYSLGAIFNRVVMVFGAVLIVHAARGNSLLMNKVLSGKLGKTLSTYSYSLYLVHAPVLVTVFFLLGPVSNHISFFRHVLIAYLAIIASTFIVYKYFEKPALNWIHRK